MAIDSVYEIIRQYVKRFGIRPMYLYVGQVEYAQLVRAYNDTIGGYTICQNGKEYVLQLEIVKVEKINWLKAGE